jgi:peptidoglycan/LPS O-acetylase OafA/YrhL
MLALGLLICAVLPQGMVLSGSIWLLGVALSLLNRYVNVSRRACAITGLVVFPLFVACLWRARTLGAASLESDLSVGISFSLLLGCLIRIESAPNVMAALSKKFADFSYTLYLTHFPLAAALACLVLKNQRWQPSLAAAGVFCSATILLLAYAYGVYLLFERNTKHVQVVLKRCFAAWLPFPAGALKAGGEP